MKRNDRLLLVSIAGALVIGGGLLSLSRLSNHSTSLEDVSLSLSPTREIIYVIVTSAPESIAASSSPQPDPPSGVIALSDDVRQHIREIYQYGQQLGNDPHVFSKVGDSITVSTMFFHPIGAGLYDLGEYEYLQSVIDYFSSSASPDSFGRTSLVAGVGWAAKMALDPAFVLSEQCLPAELPLVCEYRVTRPSIALIMFGTNDVGYRSLQAYRDDLTRIAELSESMGVIPILSTIPFRPELARTVETFNTIVRDVAQTQKVPLWDYAVAMQNLPNHGLTSDNLHPSTPPGGFERAADFSITNLRYGYVLRNLTALQILYSVRWYLHSN